MEVMGEFGYEIPWLEPLRSIVYSTNSAYFRDRLLQALSIDEEEIVPLQFVTSEKSREYVGGVIHFLHSPENFKDRRNREIEERFAAENYHFMSCLQVREIWRNQGHGREIIKRALRAVLLDYQKIWGVVSDPRLIPWYSALGGKLRSPLENKDGLWLISWDLII
jgi:GNAT superfamily N-acetyltransferase